MKRPRPPQLGLVEPEIVKVQVPVVGAIDRWLIYAQDAQRPRMQEQRPTSAMKQAMGADLKAYFEATWSGTDKYWTVGKRVEGPSW
jgi:hypothetical protein